MRFARRALTALAALAALGCVALAVLSNRPAPPQPLPIGSPAAGLVVPAEGAAVPLEAAASLADVPQGSDTISAPVDDRLNLNTASLAELTTLPGIGEKLAQAIISAREVFPFHYVEDLRAVPGIGEKRLAQLRPYVRVE